VTARLGAAPRQFGRLPGGDPHQRASIISGLGNNVGAFLTCSRPAQAWRPLFCSSATLTCRSMTPRTSGVAPGEVWPGSEKDRSRGRPAGREAPWHSSRCNNSGWDIARRLPFSRWYGIYPARRGPSSMRARTTQTTGAGAVQGPRTWNGLSDYMYGKRSENSRNCYTSWAFYG